MKASNANKAVSVLLSVAMCPMMVPTAAFADENGTQPGSPATAEQPGDAQAGAEQVATMAAEQSAEASGQQIATQSDEDADAAAAGTVTVNGTSYDSLEAAFVNATPDAAGTITYTINGKVTVSNSATSGWNKLIVFDEDKYAGQVKKVSFLKGNDSAEICIDDDVTVFGANAAVDVSFDGLTLSRTKASYKADVAEGTDYFSVWVTGGSVSYSNCVFPNGAHNNWYGSTQYNGCSFANAKTSGGGSKYGLWISSNEKGAAVSVSDCSFTKARGIKLYYTAAASEAPSLSLSNTTFSNLTDDKAAVSVCQPAKVSMSRVAAENCSGGLLNKAFENVSAGLTAVTIPCGTDVSGDFNLQASDNPTEQEFAISAGTFKGEVLPAYCADGFTVEENADGTYGVKQEAPAAAAKTADGAEYVTLEAALAAVTPDNPLTEVSETAWPVATPVYYNGKFYASDYKVPTAEKGALDVALAAVAEGSVSNPAKIYVRPGFVGGTSADNMLASVHSFISRSVEIYGNGAQLNRAWEPFAENVDDNDSTINNTLTDDISVAMYNLNNGAGFWGSRVSSHTINVTLQNCDNVHVLLMNKVSSSDATSKTNFTIKNSTFENGSSKFAHTWPVVNECPGSVQVDKCTFTNIPGSAVSVNNKVGGTTTVSVSDTKFDNCGSSSPAVRLTGQSADATVNATLTNLTFENTPTGSKDIIVGNSDSAKNGAKVTYTVSGTNATADVYRQGASEPETVTATDAKATSGTNEQMVAQAIAKNGSVKGTFTNLKDAVKSAGSGGTVRLLADTAIDGAIIVSSGTRTFDLGSFRIVNKGTSATAAVIKTTGTASVVVNADPTGGIDAGSGAGANYAFYASGGTITVNGGYYTVGLDKDGKGNPIAYADKGRTAGKVIINGGIFNAEDPAYTLNAKDGSGASIEVNGGTFKGFDPFNNNTEGVGTNLVPEGSGVNRTVAEDGTVGYEVAQGVAQVVDANGKSVKVYDTLQAAIDAAENGQTVKLTDDVALDSAVTVADASKSIAIDLNGKTISRTKGNAILVSGGKLVVKDSTATQPIVDGATVSGYKGGVIKNTGSYTCVSVSNAGQLTVESGMIQSVDRTAVYVNGNQSPEGAEDVSPVASTATIKGGYMKSQEYGIGVAGRGAVLNVEGGVVEAMDNAAVAGNGTNSASRYDGGTTINISGGSLVGHIQSTGFIACGVYHPQKGELSITGGSVYAENGVGVLARGGNVSITGGSVTASGTASGKVGDSNIIANCYGVYVDGSAGYYGATDADFGASISGDAAVSADAGVSVLNVTNNAGKGTKATASVSGGTFSSEIPADYCASGYAPAASKDVDGNTVYGVAAGLMNFWGGSLRIDKYENADGTFNTNAADLRFGFNFDLPEGAERKAFGFKWGTSADNLDRAVKGENTRDAAKEPLASDPSGVTGTISNLVVTDIPTENFATTLYAQMWVTYVLNGVEYTIHTDVQSRSVSEIANKIIAAGNAGAISTDSKQFKYAQQLLGASA